MNAIETILSNKLSTLKEQGAYRYFLEVNKSAQHFPDFYYRDEQGQSYKATNWCSNDYLAQSTREEVIAKLSFTAHRSGAGSGGTRNISGTTVHHQALEKTLAHWHKKESALLFNGAYAANHAVLQTLGRHIPDLIFLSDEKNHASIIEGIRCSGNLKLIFRHNNIEHLQELLCQLPLEQPKIIVFESVYSMNGTIAPTREFVSLAKQYNALTYVDEVHAVGLYGPTGAGILEQENLHGEIDFINGTLSKAIGVYGGYVAASKTYIDFIRSFGSGFIFTTSLPPAICRAAEKSIELIQGEPHTRNIFFEQVIQLRRSLHQYAIPCQFNNSHITIVPIGDATQCRLISEALLRLGIYLQPINYPTVPHGEACLRIIITNRHSAQHIEYLAQCLNQVLHGNHNHYRSRLKAVAHSN